MSHIILGHLRNTSCEPVSEGYHANLENYPELLHIQCIIPMRLCRQAVRAVRGWRDNFVCLSCGRWVKREDGKGSRHCCWKRLHGLLSADRRSMPQPELDTRFDFFRRAFFLCRLIMSSHPSVVLLVAEVVYSLRSRLFVVFSLFFFPSVCLLCCCHCPLVRSSRLCYVLHVFCFCSFCVPALALQSVFLGCCCPSLSTPRRLVDILFRGHIYLWNIYFHISFFLLTLPPGPVFSALI